MQSRKMSLVESLLNVGSGMLLAIGISQLAHIFEEEIQRYVYSGFVWNISIESNVVMSVVLTVVSVIRGYLWRRTFNMRSRT